MPSLITGSWRIEAQQQIVDQDQQFAEIDRLDQVVVHAGAAGLDPVHRHAARGDHDQTNVRTKPFAQTHRKRNARLIGKVVVQQHDFRNELRQSPLKRSAVADGQNFVSGMHQERLQFFLLPKVVFYYDNARHSYLYHIIRPWPEAEITMPTPHSRNAVTQPFSQIQEFLAGLNLQSRFLLIMGASSLFFALLSWAVFNNFTEHLIERIGARFAETQMLYDKARTLQPLTGQIALVRQSADSFQLKEWAANENDPTLYQRTTEQMRGNFFSHSYFIALVGSKTFYYDDHARQLHYTLNPSSPDDAWFFDFIKSGDNQRIRIAADSKLNVNKIWIMAPIRSGNDILGALGIGIDLDDFVKNTNIHLPGVTNMFINRDAAIQIYNDVDHTDFPGVPNFYNQLHSTDQIVGVRSGRQWVRQAIENLNNTGQGVETEFVHINGKRYLAGMIALPELGWYDLTLLDMSILLPQFDFIRMVLVIVVSTLLVLAILAFSLHKLVLKPVATLTDAVSRIRRGDYTSKPVQESSGEVQELASQFHDMATAIHNTQYWLEAEIEKRTRQLFDAQKMLEISLQHEREGRETQANLMALMAHEMRNPIAVIGNTAQMLKVLAQSEHPDLLPRIEKIMRSVRQLATLMDNFLTEKWLDMDKHGLNLEPGDLNTVCAEIAESFADRPNHPIRFEPWRGDTLFYADWQLIRIAVVNLLDNACKYSSANNEVLLRVLPQNGDMLCVEVSNRGAGIPPELQSRIFEKYVRGQHEGSIQGSGLGLYLVNWIAKFHGGHTDILSSERQGNTFRLCLPRYGAEPPLLAAPTQDSAHTA